MNNMNIIEHINNTVFCKLAPSPIHGIGVFAIRDIKAGTELTDYRWDSERVLYNIPMNDVALIQPEIRKLILDRMLNFPGDTFSFFSPNSDQMLQSFMNHAKTPNSDGKIALRDIKEGEEITEDYNVIPLCELNRNNFLC